jgi:hypothetical protein
MVLVSWLVCVRARARVSISTSSNIQKTYCKIICEEQNTTRLFFGRNAHKIKVFMSPRLGKKMSFLSKIEMVFDNCGRNYYPCCGGKYGQSVKLTTYLLKVAELDNRESSFQLSRISSWIRA